MNKRMKIDTEALQTALGNPSTIKRLRLGHESANLTAAGLTPDEVLLADWLGRLKLLYGIPFNYLVPNTSMLPEESIRFFYVDTIWLDYLAEGALSLGRFTDMDKVHDSAYAQDMHVMGRVSMPKARVQAFGHLALHLSAPKKERLLSAPIPSNETVSGFLLRSGVVSGWQGLEVEAFLDDKQTQPSTLLRMDHLSPNTLLCIFEGKAVSYRIHEHPEILHFGVDISEKPPFTYSKSFRFIVDVDGHKAGTQVDKAVAPALQMADYVRSGNSRVLRINDLAQAMQKEVQNKIDYDGPFTAAEFALEMVEGVQAVDFTLNHSNL